jgi:hypothetical protein
MSDQNNETKVDKAAFEKARKQRNNVVGLTLAGLAILFFLVTIVKLSGNG